MLKIGKSGEYLGKILEPLLKNVLLLMKNTLKPLAKNRLIPLRLKPAASVIDAAIHKKMFGSGATILIISNEEIKSLKEPRLLVKVVKQFKMKEKNKKADFLKCY